MNKKFIIFGAPRTGSTLLVKTLNSLPGVCCHGELMQENLVRGYQDGFNHWNAGKKERAERARRLLEERNSDPLKFIEKAWHDGVAAGGFKMIYQDFLNPRWRNAIDSLLENADIRFIHLKRQNSLRRYVSERVLGEGGPIHSALGGRKNVKVKVHIDIPSFIERSLILERQGKKLDSMLSGTQQHTLNYESLAADTNSEITGVCKFLGLSQLPSDITPALSKVGAANLRDVVTNYDELLANEVTKIMATSD